MLRFDGNTVSADVTASQPVTVSAPLTGNGTSAQPIGFSAASPSYTGIYQHTDKRVLLWSATGNPYNTNITLAEPITNFEEIMIYSSGGEAVSRGVHLAKNLYVADTGLMGCRAWGYSPWAVDYLCNYILGADILLSGNSGHIGSASFCGNATGSTTWAAGKWTGTQATRMLMPYKIFGMNRTSNNG